MQMHDEYHVASFIAHAKESTHDVVSKLINDIPGGEVHAVSDKGKIVFTIEAQSQNIIGDYIDQIKQRVEILNLSPVYHQFLAEE